MSRVLNAETTFLHEGRQAMYTGSATLQKQVAKIHTTRYSFTKGQVDHASIMRMLDLSNFHQVLCNVGDPRQIHNRSAGMVAAKESVLSWWCLIQFRITSLGLHFL